MIMLYRVKNVIVYGGKYNFKSDDEMFWSVEVTVRCNMCFMYNDGVVVRTYGSTDVDGTKCE